MAERRPVWLGRDEAEGPRAEARPDAEPPAHWRLEAMVAADRPRSLAVGPAGRHAVFVEDRDASDVWLLDLEGGVPQRLTAGRDLAPHWEDTQPRPSPDGSTVAYADDGHVHLVATAGGPPQRLVEGGAPVWVDDRTLVIAVEHEDTSRLAVVGVDDLWPRRLASDPGALDDHGDEADAAVAPGGDAVAYVFRPRADLGRAEIRVADLRTGAVRALTGTPGLQDREPAWSPDGGRIAYASERPGWWALHVVGRNGGGDRRLTGDGADYAQPRWHPDGVRILAVRGRRNRFDLVVVDAAGGGEEVVAPGGAWRSAHWAADGAIAGAYEDHATPPELRLVTPGGPPRTVHAPAPLPVRRAPHVAPEEVTYRSLDGLEIPAFLFRPPSASVDEPAAAVVYPHGGPTAAYVDHWDGLAQYLVAKGYAWLAPNFRGSTGYGRDFERRNHGVWGVADTRDCLAAADFLRTLDWIDGDRLGIVGGSYGAYLAVLAVADDPEHRFRCAVAMYGDSDIRMSWAHGDRDGRLDLQRMMGHPAAARAAYRAGSPLHRLEGVRVPLLVAHGERDERVHPQQSARLVDELRRLGKRFEYVTYPTEAHGFLRAGPRLDFLRSSASWTGT